MALPTAPLGQLPSIQMPFSIPTYEKGPSILEKALGALLVNVASGVAQHGTENLMSRDYAGEFGETPTKGFGRLLGPKVGENEAKQRRQNIFVTGEAEKERDFNRDQAELKYLNEQGLADAAAANARLRQQDAIQGNLDERFLQDKNAGLRIGQEATAQQELARLRASLEASDPGRLAQAEADRARARQSNAEAGLYERFANRGTSTAQPAAPAPTSNVAKFAQGQNAGPRPSSQESLPHPDLLVGEPPTLPPRPMEFDPNTLGRRPVLEPNVAQPADFGTDANDAIADTMRAGGYGIANFFSPSNWHGNMEGAYYDPTDDLVRQLEARIAALANQQGPTAQQLRAMLEQRKAR